MSRMYVCLLSTGRVEVVSRLGDEDIMSKPETRRDAYQ